MKKLLSLIIAVITFYGCQDDILSDAMINSPGWNDEDVGKII